jgi:DNA polymerase
MVACRLSASQQAVLAEMGIDVWERRLAAPGETSNPLPVSESVAVRNPAVAPAPVATPAAEQPTAVVAQSAADAFLTLNKEILTCTRCELHKSRTQAVCGVGNLQADILVIGEAPGQEEDLAGEPFVGPAGQLLNEMLAAIEVERAAVFIANILKCRPPNNDKPKPAQAEQCLPFLERQIGLVKPRLIILAGGVAANNLLNIDMPVGKLRGKVHRYGENQIPVVVTYHPAYLLRKPSEKAKSWADLKLAVDVLEGSVD